MRCLRSAFGVSCAILLAACSDGTGPGPVRRSTVPTTSARTIWRWASIEIIDPPRMAACVRLPAAAGRRRRASLSWPVATARARKPRTASRPRTGTGRVTRRQPPPRRRLLAAPVGLPGPARARERSTTCCASGSERSGRGARRGRCSTGRVTPSATAAPPPVVGEQRTFDVLAARMPDRPATDFVQVDRHRPVGGAAGGDLRGQRRAGRRLHPGGPRRRRRPLRRSSSIPIDTTAFGRESDIDGEWRRRRSADPAGERAQSRLQQHAAASSWAISSAPICFRAARQSGLERGGDLLRPGAGSQQSCVRHRAAFARQPPARRPSFTNSST